MSVRRPSLPPMPDLSHLTEEERQIIEGVLQRQKQEEDKNQEILQNLEKEVKSYEKQLDDQTSKGFVTGGVGASSLIGGGGSAAPGAVESIIRGAVDPVHHHADNQDAGPVCELCHKTKFADGLGNPCHYCKRRTCARCGTKVQMKPTKSTNTNYVDDDNKFLWTCKLCKKKQELLAKSGQWYHGTQANPVGIETDPSFISDSHQNNHRQMFQQTYMPMQRSMDRPDLDRINNRDLKRQYSLSEMQQQQQQHQKYPLNNPRYPYNDQYPQRSSSQPHKKLPQIPPRALQQQQQQQQQNSPTMGKSMQQRFPTGPNNNMNYDPPYSESSRRRYMRSTEQLHYDSIESQNPNMINTSFTPGSYQRRNYSNINTNINQSNKQFRNSPDNYRGRSGPLSASQEVLSGSHNPYGIPSQRQLPRLVTTGPPNVGPFQFSQEYQHNQQRTNLQRRSSPSTNNRSSAATIGTISGGNIVTSANSNSFFSTSLSSDAASEPNIIYRHQPSSSQDYTSGSNRQYSTGGNHSHAEDRNAVCSPYTDVGDYNKRRRQYQHYNSYSSSSEEDIHTSVCCTSCDDREVEIDSVSDRDYYLQQSNQRKIQPNNNTNNSSLVKLPNSSASKQPVSWKMSKDNCRLIGHMILQKAHLSYIDNVSSSSPASTVVMDNNSVTGLSTNNTAGTGGILGLKVIGGKMTNSGRLGAFITKVKSGSIADIVGGLKAGDEVLEWNGRSFKNLTYEEVNDIILDSRFDSEVELIVQRIVEQSPTMQNVDSHKHSKTFEDDAPKIQLKMQYSKPNQQLTVVLLQAVNLIPSPSKPVNYPCSAFVKLYLLPEKNEQNYRRSRLIPNNNNPRWNQTFNFTPFKVQDSRTVELEVNIFDYDRETEQTELVGEVIIDLRRANLQNMACWYPIYLVDAELSATEDSEPGEFSQDEVNRDDRHYWDNTPVNVDSQGSLYNLSKQNRHEKSPNYNSDKSQTPRRQQRQSKSDYHLDASDAINPITAKSSNHPSPYPDLRFDKRFQVPDEFSEQIDGPINRRNSNSFNEAENGKDIKDVNDIYSEEGPRRIDQRRDEIQRRQSNQIQYDDENNSEILSDITSDESSKQKLQQSQSQMQQPILMSSTARRPSESQKTLAEIRRNSQLQQPSISLNETSEIENLELSTKRVREVRIKTDRKESDSMQSDGGSISDTGVSGPNRSSGRENGTTTAHTGVTRRKRRPSIGQKFSTVLGFSRKSSSTSNLDKKPRSSFQRCEEVLPANYGSGDGDAESIKQSAPVLYPHPSEYIPKQKDRISRKDGSNISQSAKMSTANESHVESFVEGLGPGQLVGRQVLGMPCLGEIQLSFIDRKGRLEVEVIRARNLVPKNNSKLLPQPYVKLHLLEGKMSLEKQRTTVSQRRTLDPLYQQQIFFNNNYKHRILQVSVWGEHGRMEKKSFMGMCDILLDDLDLRSIVFGWYKLFGITASNVHHHHQSAAQHKAS